MTFLNNLMRSAERNPMGAVIVALVGASVCTGLANAVGTNTVRIIQAAKKK